MNNKGYPKTQFEIEDQTSVLQINTSTVDGNNIPLFMATYTSDKGSEDWEVLYGLEAFIKNKGGISFSKHGQPQLAVAEMLRNGAAVLGKRIVADDATLGNTTIKARVVVLDGVSYVYFYTVSSTDASTFDEACEIGYGTFDPSNEATTGDNGSKSYDIPLFTVCAEGRGISNLTFRLVPEYYASKSNNYIKYSFEISENVSVIESIVCTMNPDIIVDGVNQSISTKVNNNSNQVSAKLYEDGILKLINVLSDTATMNGESVPVSELINMDFINGFDKKGTTAIGGIVTEPTSKGGADLWSTNKPSDINKVYSLDDANGIPVANGKNGNLGNAPITNKEEYDKLLLGAFGANQESAQFKSDIYDLDNYKVDAIFDCGYSVPVKKAITEMVDFRGDMVFIEDLGTNVKTIDDMKNIVCNTENLPLSRNTAIYHNYFKIFDPYTKKPITVTMPYLLISRMIKHIDSGVGKPFAGMANGIQFPEIISGSINFIPMVIPGKDQKQELADLNINYLSLYDGIPVMETMYVNSDAYTKLSFLHNIMGVQEIVKVIRTRCPRTRYTFLDGTDLEDYISDVNTIINSYKSNFKSISMTYMADEKYESNNIFYAVLKVQFKEFVQEEFFKIIAID